MKTLHHDDVKAIIVHHTGPPTSPTTHVSAIRAWHMGDPTQGKGRGWDDIGYHYLVGLNSDGHPVIHEGRPVCYQGAHCKGRNHDTIGVALVGDYTHNRPPLALWNTVLAVLSILAHAYDVPVYGHREVALSPTECPGGAIDMDHMRRCLAL